MKTKKALTHCLCGRAVYVYSRKDHPSDPEKSRQYQVACLGCGRTGPLEDTEDEAIMSWESDRFGEDRANKKLNEAENKFLSDTTSLHDVQVQ